MAFTTDDFNKVWASTSPLTPYEFSETNYKEGWNFVGATPPSRQMWDYLQKLTDEKIKYIYNNLIPCGIVQAFAGNTVPDGWLLCDGSAISRTDYADLYAVIGDTYGAGDGTSTFNLPDLIDKFVQGNAVAGTEHSAGLPNITGQIQVVIPMNVNPNYSSAILQIEGSGCAVGINPADGNYFNGAGVTTTPKNRTLDIDASRSSSVYGGSTTVQPPSVTMQYIIKY